MPDRTVGDVLESALAEIRTKGWCQDALEYSDGSMCAVGAVNHALLGNAHAYTWTSYERAQRDDTKKLIAHRDALALLDSHIPSDYEFSESVKYYWHDDSPMSRWARVVSYNNARGRTKAEIEEWFTKAALDAGISV